MRSRRSESLGELADYALERGARAAPDKSVRPVNLPLFPTDPAAAAAGTKPKAHRRAPVTSPDPIGEDERREVDPPPKATDLEPTRASFAQRLIAAGADFVVHLALLAGALTAEALMDLEPRLEDWPGLMLFVLAFSFLYAVIPLAFWGQTPGMAWSRIRSVDGGQRPLTFGQTAARWLGSLLTAALLGLPLLLTFRGRSLTDLLSRSSTYQTL